MKRNYAFSSYQEWHDDAVKNGKLSDPAVISKQVSDYILQEFRGNHWLESDLRNQEEIDAFRLLVESE